MDSNTDHFAPFVLGMCNNMFVDNNHILAIDSHSQRFAVGLLVKFATAASSRNALLVEQLVDFL